MEGVEGNLFAEGKRAKQGAAFVNYFCKSANGLIALHCLVALY